MNKTDYIEAIDRRLEDIRTTCLDLLIKSNEVSLLDFDQLSHLSRERRRILSLSQAALAELTGLAIRTIVKFEQGDEGISLKNVKTICKALGITICLKN